MSFLNNIALWQKINPYKQSLGFQFGYDNQKKCDILFYYLYNNSPYHDITFLTEEPINLLSSNRNFKNSYY